MKLSELLEVKGRNVYTARIGETVLEVVKKLVTHNVGAMIILDDKGSVSGVISERDILRLSASNPGGFGNLKVADYMTRNLVTATSSASVEDAQAVMTERRIRHLPVVDDGKLCGMVSLGDLVKAKLADAEFETRHLTEFVMGKYPA